MKSEREIIAELEKRLFKLEQENAHLKKENADLKDRLGLNSSNSSIPSSKEFYKIQKQSKKPTGRKRGGQVGHKGSFSEPMEADKVVKIDLEDMQCSCGGELRLEKAPYVHQRVEIPPITPEVTEYHLSHARCKRCGMRHSASMPSGLESGIFGPRIKGMIGALGGFYKNSKRNIENILFDMFGLKMSLGSVSNYEGRISSLLKENYEEIESEASYSSLVHIDETSHYRAGKLGWCWIFASLHAVFIKLTPSRGKEVLENSPFGPNDILLISDRYAAYNYFNRDLRQVCWAHLKREFTRLSHSKYPEIRSMGIGLCEITSELFALKKTLTNGEIDRLYFLRRARKLRRRCWDYLKTVAYMDPSMRASKIASNIMKSEDMMWKFLYDPMEIPLTNNFAEQLIRHYVIYRKNSYFTQSERGDRYLERIISLYLTCKQKALNPFQYLLDIITPEQALAH